MLIQESPSLSKRALVAALVVSHLAWTLPPAYAAIAPLPPRIDFAALAAARLGDTQAIGPHYSREWEKLSDLARQAQGQGSLTKSGPRAFLAEPVEVAKITAQVVGMAQELERIAVDLDQQFRRDEQYLRDKGMPAVLFERHAKAWQDFRGRREAMEDAAARLAAAHKLGNYDAQKSALEEMAKLVTAMPSAKSFLPMSVEALRREGKQVLARAPLTTTAELRQAIEGSEAAIAKIVPASPAPADLLETDDAQVTPKIQELAVTTLGRNPVAIFNWVRNTIDFVPTRGSIQGAEVTRINRRGNATDTASLLIALLRASNIHARYVYGTVEMPIARARNWLGGNIAPNQVVELMAKGGIPTQQVIAGGQVSAIRFEHTWVEAFVDANPSRGAVNRAPSAWLPLDASVKAYDVKAPIALTAGVPFDAQAALNQAVAAMPANRPAGSVTRFDLAAFDAALDSWRPQAVAYANQVKPNATLKDVRGYATIVQANLPTLAGSLPYAVIAQGNTYSALPASLKHVLRIKYYASETDYATDSASMDIPIPLAKVGLSTIGVDYVPATQADVDLFARLRRDNEASLAPYLIQVKPQIQVEGVAVQGGTGTAIAMGTIQYWKADIVDPQGLYPSSPGNRTIAGSHTAFVVDAGGITADMVQKRLDMIPAGMSHPLREGLQQAGMHFWMLRDHQDQIWASQFQGKVVRLPSVGAFSAPLQVGFSFGVARTGQFRGFQTDVKRNLYATVNPTQAQQVQMFTLIGNTGSLLESSVWEMLFGRQLGSGMSTATILATANEQGIPVFLIDSSNLGTVLPQLSFSNADIKQEISNAVNAGKRVVVPQSEVKLGAWQGVGYVIQDPQDGTGVYQIEGGLSGGLSPFCILKALLESCIFQKLLARQVQKFLDTLMQQAVKSALAAAAGVAVPVVAGSAAQMMWFLAFQFALIDFTEMLATGSLEEGAEKVIADILACSLHSPCAPGGPATSGNPVVVATGEKFQVDADYIGAGDNPLVFSRTYLSKAAGVGAHMGNKWRHSYERSIHVPPPPPALDTSGVPIGGGYSVTFEGQTRASGIVSLTQTMPESVLAIRGDGSYFQFNLRQNNYRPDTDVGEVLARLGGTGPTTGWTYLNSNDETEEYDATGRLTRITNRQGMTTTLSYNGTGQLQQVQNHFGRTLVFGYNPAGDVETVTDPAQRIWRYGYDQFGNLTSVTGPDQKVRRYHYETTPRNALLTGITDENDRRWSTYKYDYKGRVIDEQHAANSGRYRFDYDSDTQVRVTDPLGTVRAYTFQKVVETMRLKEVTQPCTMGCAQGGVAKVSYDANGFVASRTDFNNVQTTYTRDLRGLERSRTEAAGTPLARTTSTEYDPVWRVPTRITEPTAAGPATRTTVLTLDTRGNMKKREVTVAGETRTWLFDQNTLGQQTLLDGPRTDVVDTTRWTYVPASGNLDTITDAAGNLTRYENYDQNGRPQKMTDPNGLVTLMVYDERGRLRSSSAGGETTQYEYDGAGNLKKLILPDDSFLAYGYDDAQRLTSITDGLGNSVTYTLDEIGNRKKEETRDPQAALAQTMSRVFDALGQVKDLFGAASQRTMYEYDPQGNLKRATDPLTHVTDNEYDALNRLKKVTEPQLSGAPAAGNILYGYDPQDNLTSVTDQRNLVTGYAYSGFDELKTLTSPDTGVTQYTYDPAGNVKTMQDARGQTAAYTYDPLDRLKELVYTGESVVFTYDDVAVSANSKGRLSKVTDGSGSTTYAYDPHGRVSAKTQVTGTLTRQVGYGYNPKGQLATLTTPSGQAVGYSYANNQVTGITVNGQNVLTGATYFPFGEVKKWTWGNGQPYERVYDLDGRIQSVTLAGPVRTYGFDTASRITGLTDRQGPTTVAAATVGYDNLDRLTSTSHSVGGTTNEVFAYDLIGNRVSHTMTLVSSTTTGPQIKTYTYSPTSNRLTRIDTQDIGYDAAGNTQSDGTLTYVYSGRNRLTEVKQGAAPLATYQHNAWGERVTKTLGGATTTFVYDEDGRLLGEYGAAGALIQETVWLEDAPVATLRPKAGGGIDIFYVWADHLDTPRAITASTPANTLVWKWQSDPFGTTAPQESGLAYNLRFPGQYFDAETATHYNYFRDYDPATGRYRQSDPIGLMGADFTTYSYTGGDPLWYVDPNGETRIEVKPKPGWSDAQNRAFCKKVGALNKCKLVVTCPTRGGSSASGKYKKAGNIVPPGCDVDHTQDLQLGGCDQVCNMAPLDKSVNRSLGAQIKCQIKKKGLGPGDPISGVDIRKKRR